MPNHADIAERVTACFQTVFPYLDREQILTLSKPGLDAWDSLASISLVTVLEEEFDIEFDDATIDAMTSFTAAADAVSARAET